MTKRSRTILFLIFISLFILIVPPIVLYTQGYRLDIGEKKLKQTGGFSLKIDPRQAEIYIDGESKKTTDMFFGSAFIDNLLPQKYKIEAKKEGYHSWEKNLEVKEKEVTEAKNIVLFPNNPNLTLLSQGVKNLWFSPDGKKLITKEMNQNGWGLKLYNLDKNIKSQLLNERDVYINGADLLGLEFSQDSKEIYLDIGMKEQEKNFSLILDKTPVALEERIKPLIPDNVIAYQKINNEIYYLDDSGQIFRTDQSFGQKIKLSDAVFPIKQETEYKLTVIQDLIFLQEEKNLYLLNQDTKSFDGIQRPFDIFFDRINSLKASPDNKKLVYFSDNEIWVLFIKDDLGQPHKTAGEKLFINRFSEKIGDVFWINSSYLAFNVGDKIKISEIDDRDKMNIIDFIELKNPKILWDENNKKLNILSEGNLYSSESLF